jgi:hypothetical protein
MSDDIGLMGPRKAGIFAYLIQITAMVMILGVLFSQFYGISWIKTISQYLLRDLSIIYTIAGIISISVFLYSLHDKHGSRW